MKARDIIPGWPKGRSTLSSYDNQTWRPEHWMFPEDYCTALYADLALEREYHENQQRMVDEFRGFPDRTKVVIIRYVFVPFMNPEKRLSICQKHETL